MVNMNVVIYFYDGIKYDRHSARVGEATYKITSYSIVGGEKARQIESETDSDGTDDFSEYLVLELEDGETATFRNSYVDMFRKF